MFVGDILKKRIRQTVDFKNPIDKAAINLMMAANYVRAEMDRVCMQFGITRVQYNVLRILRGAGAEGHPRFEVAERMFEKAPDVTRLIDRLEKQGYALRERSSDDRRHSITRISEKGLKLLDQIEPKLDEVRRFMSKKLSLPEWIALSSICEKIYAEET